MTLFVFDHPPMVFIRVRKTGSTSVLRGLVGGRDRASAVVENGDDRHWEGRLAFGFVRNPFDRMIRCLEMFRSYPKVNEHELELQTALDVDRLMDIMEDQITTLVGDSLLSKLQKYVYLARASFIGRFESFEEHYRRLAALIGRSVDSVPRHRFSAHRDYRPYFDARSRSCAELLLRNDLLAFGYSF